MSEAGSPASQNPPQPAPDRPSGAPELTGAMWFRSHFEFSYTECGSQPRPPPPEPPSWGSHSVGTRDDQLAKSIARRGHLRHLESHWEGRGGFGHCWSPMVPPQAGLWSSYSALGRAPALCRRATAGAAPHPVKLADHTARRSPCRATGRTTSFVARKTVFNRSSTIGTAHSVGGLRDSPAAGTCSQT